MMMPDYSYFVEKSEEDIKCQVKYIDETEVVQARLDWGFLTKNLMQFLPLEEGDVS